MASIPAFVLDTSAILALRGNEPGADRVDALLRLAAGKRARVLVSFMTRMELSYQLQRDENVEAAAQTIRLLDLVPVEWVSCDLEILERAAALKAAGGLSVADAWIAATAILRRARLVHKDPEFRAASELDHEELPVR